MNGWVHIRGLGWPSVVVAAATIAACTSAAGLDDLEFAAAGTTNVGGAGGATAASGGGVGGVGGSGTGGTGEGGTGGTISPPGCGNGTLDVGEGCDDANTAAGDGCGSDCQLEGSSDGCPAEIEITLGADGIWLADSNVGKADVTAPSCAGTSAGDAFYKITVEQGGDIRATMFSSFHHVLVLQTGCGSGELSCAPDVVPVLINAGPLTAGDTLYFMASGVDGAEGDFQIHVEYP